MALKPTEKPKPKHRKGLWSPEEDERLRGYVLKHGHGCWSSVPINTGLQRNGKSCRLRWINYLRPGLKRGTFTAQEEETILSLHRSLGNKWSQIALQLSGRTDNEIKNYWHSYLKKKVAAKTDHHHDSSSPSPSSSADEAQPQKTFEHFNNKNNSDMNTNGIINAESSLLSPEATLQRGHQDQHPSSFPRIFFAEWLAQDHPRHHHQVEYADALAAHSYSSIHQDLDPIMCDNELCSIDQHGGNYYYNDELIGSNGSGYSNSSAASSGSDDVYSSSQLKMELEDQIPEGELMLSDYFSGVDVCSVGSTWALM